MNEEKVSRWVKYPIIEVILFIFVIGFLFMAWSMHEEPCPQDKEFYLENQERNLAASAVKDTIAASLTATSIILASTALVISLYKSPSSMNKKVIIHYKYVAAYSLFSICVGALNMGWLPSLVNVHNVAFYSPIHISSAVQFTVMVFAAGRLFLVIWKFV